MQGGLRKADTLANAQKQIRAKVSTIADCARADTMVVRGTAKRVFRRENLQRENLQKEIVFEDNRWKKIKRRLGL